MTDESLKTVAAIVGAISLAIVSVMNYLRTRKLESKVAQVHVAVDGRMDQLLDLTKTAAAAQGAAERAAAHAAAAATIAAVQVDAAHQVAAAQGATVAAPTPPAAPG